MSWYRRPTYTANLNPRIYSREEVEPNFDSPATLTRSRSPAPTAVVAPPPRAAAPPLYYPGESELARQRVTQEQLPPGTTRSTNVASSRRTVIPFVSHPTLRFGWRRLVRVDMWWACLVRNESELLDDEWPEAFGGKRRLRGGDEEAEGGSRRVSRITSRRSGVSAADSGVAMNSRSGTMELQHPLEGLFKSRIDELNELIGGQLRVARVYLSLLEIVNFCWLVALIIVLGVGRGKQTPYLQGVELSLVVIILLNGIGVNGVRMRRWALARALRTRSRDWSPLPITTSTNNNLLDNAGLNAGQHFFGAPDREAEAARMRGKDQPTLRWRMRETEGSWWLSYRPIIKCELVTPSASGLIAYPPPQDDAIHINDEGQEQASAPAGLAPAYTE